MYNFCCFNYNFLFNDHLKDISKEARLLYIELCFFSDYGFVANPKSILEERKYSLESFRELLVKGELLTIPDRAEIFITSYFLHNKGLNRFNWTKSVFYVYWKGKLWFKDNGVATFKKQYAEEKRAIEDEGKRRVFSDKEKNIDVNIPIKEVGQDITQFDKDYDALIREITGEN